MRNLLVILSSCLFLQFGSGAPMQATQHAARSGRGIRSPQSAAAVQYVVVPGWNVRQLCQNSWYAVTGVSASVAPRPLSA